MGCITFLKRPDGSEIEIDLNNILAPSQIEMMRESYNDRIDGSLKPMSPSEFVEAVKSGKIDLGKIFRVENTEEQQPSSSVEEQIAELEKERSSYNSVTKVEDFTGKDDSGDIVYIQRRTNKDGSQKVIVSTSKNKRGNPDPVTGFQEKGGFIAEEIYTDFKQGPYRTPEQAGLNNKAEKIDSKIAELKSQQQPLSSSESKNIPESTHKETTETPKANFTPTEEEIDNSKVTSSKTNSNSLLGGIKKKPFSTNVGKREKAKIEEEKKRAKTIFKDIPVETRKKILTPDGRLAEGFYQNAVILSESDAEVGTAYHEAFHAFMDVVVDQKTKDQLLVEASENPDSAYYENAEEFLAEDFRDYALTREKRKGLLGKVYDLIDRLLGLIIKKKGVFDKLYRGQYTFKPKSEAGKVKFSQIAGLNPAQKREAVRGIARLVIINSQALTKGSTGVIKPADYESVYGQLKDTRDELASMNNKDYFDAVKNYDILLKKKNFDLFVKEANMMLSDLGAKETKDDLDPNNDEFENAEDIDKEIDGEVFGVNAMNFDQSAKASGFLKALIATLPDAKKEGGQIVEETSVNFPGLPIVSDRSQNWKILKKEMNGTVSKKPGVILKKLKKLGNKYPQLAEIGRMLESDNISEHHKVALQSLLSGQKVEYSTTVVAGGSVNHVNSDTKTAEIQAEKKLNTSIEVLLYKNPKLANLASEAANKMRDIRPTKDGEILIKDLSKYIEGLQMIGFPLSESEVSSYATDAKGFVKVWNEMINFANQVAKGADENNELNGKPFKQLKTLKNSLSSKENVQAERMVRGEDNKPYFTEAQNHFASKQLGLFNSKEKIDGSDLTEGQQAIEDLLDTEYHKASLALKQLQKDPSSITLEAFLVRTTNGDTGKGGGNLPLTDDLSDRINRVLTNLKGAKTGIVPITQADKSMTYLLKGLPVQDMYDREGEKANSDALNIFSGYAFAELDRIVAHLNRPVKENIKVYDKKKKAQESTWFPRLSFGKEFSDKLFSKDEETGLYKVNPNAREVVEQVVSEDLKSAIDKSFSKAKKIGIVKYKNNNKNLPMLRGVDEGIQGQYLSGNYHQGLKAMYSEFVLNSMMANIEYTMMFTGDPAFYKDLDKRVPSTIATGIDLVPFEAKDRKNPDKTTTKAGKFKVAVLEDFEGDPNDDDNRAHSSFVKKGKGKGAYEIYFENPKLNHFNLKKGLLAPYFKNNKADAQGYITPQRLMDLFRGMGKVSEEIIEAFDRLTKNEYGDNYAQMTSDMEVIYKKMSGQPLKGMYYGLHKDGDVTRPVYLKYSQAVLWPGLVEGTRLQRLYDQMVHQGIDEAVFESGVKVGAKSINNVSESLEGDLGIGKLKTFDLDNFNWKLQQDLPTGKEEMQRAAQSPRNVAANVGSKSERLKKKVQKFQDVEIEVSKRGATDLAMDFKADKYGNADISSIAEKLKNDAIKKEKDSNLIDLLERVEKLGDITLDDIPGISSLVESELLSTITKRTVKQKIKGTSYVQLSNIGFQPMSELSKEVRNSQKTIWFKDKKELRGPRMSEDGKSVVPGDILLPYNVIKDLPSSIQAQIREGKLTGKQVEKHLGDTIKNLVGFRIPNQAMSSNDVLNIAGVLPPHAGDTVVTYTEVTGKTGADFDIDKMYIMTPHVKWNNSKNRLQWVKPDTRDSEEAVQQRYERRKEEVYLSSREYKELRNEYKQNTKDLRRQRDLLKDSLKETVRPEKGVEETDPNRIAILKKIEPITEKIAPHKEKFEADSKALMDKVVDSYWITYEEFAKQPIEAQQTQKALENMRLKAHGDIISDPDSFIELITPLDNDDLRDDAKYITVLEKIRRNEVDKDLLKSITKGEKLTPAMAQEYMENEDQGALNFADPMTQLEIKAKNAAGKMGVAITADQLASIPLFQLAKVGLETKSNFFGGEMDLSKELDSDGNLITLNLSAYLNAYVDNAKDPYISLVNNNRFTSSTGFLMLRAGVPMETVNRFLSQPIIKDYVKMMEKDESPLSEFKTAEPEGDPKYSIPVFKDGKVFSIQKNGNKNALARVIEFYGGSTKEDDMIKGRPVKDKLTKNKLEDNIATPGIDRMDQLHILNEFLALEDQAKTLVSLVKMTSVSSKGAYRSLGERLKAKQSSYVKDHKSVINGNNLLEGTLIGQHTSVTNSWADNLLSNALEGFSEVNRSTALTFFDRMNKTIDATHVNRMTTFINSGLRASNGAYAVEDSNTLFKGKNNVGNQLNALKKSGLVDGNEFVDALYVDKPFKQGPISEGIATFVKFGQGDKDMNADAIDKLIGEWRVLLSDDRVFKTKGGREYKVSDIAKDLIKYAFHSSLGQKSFSSFYHLIPSEEIINGKKEVKDTYGERERLADLYAIHNHKDFFTKVKIKPYKLKDAPKGELHLEKNKEYFKDSDLVSENRANPYIKTKGKDRFNDDIENLYVLKHVLDDRVVYKKVDNKMLELKEEGRGSRYDITGNYTDGDAWNDYDVRSSGDLLFEEQHDNFEEHHSLEYVSKGEGFDLLVDGVSVAKEGEFFKNKEEALARAKDIYNETDGVSKNDKYC